MPTYHSYYDAYTKLNNWVYHNLFETLLPNTNVIMAFHSQSHNVCEIVKQDFDITDACFYLAQCDWSNDLCVETNRGVPQYLGFIALQVYVATTRDDSDGFTEDAYNPRLADYLFDSNDERALAKLQKKYRGQNQTRNQEKVYESFRDWCGRRGLSIYLADEVPFGRPGCYVQYPLSLSILRKKDLDSMRRIFHRCGLAVHEEIEFVDFKSRIGHRLPNNIQRIFEKIQDRSDYKQAFWSQLYTAYLEWNGEYETPVGKKERTTNTGNRHAYSIFWCKEESSISPCFYDNDKQIEKPPKPELFYLQDPLHANDWQYIKDGQISKQWENSEMPIGKLQYIFICQLNHKLTSVAQEIEQIAKGKRTFNSYDLFLLDAENISRLIQKFPLKFPQEATLKLVGGIKIERSIWMYGAGPQMLCNSSRIKRVVLWYGNTPEQIDISSGALVNRPPGIYFIQYSGTHPFVRFEIQEIEPHPRERMCGWEIGESGFKPSSKKHDAHGLDFSGCTEFIKKNILLRKQNVVRDWLNQEICDEKESKGNSIITQVLRRAKNGVSNRKN